LAALRSFFGFVAGREPAAIAQCAEILRIPTKRAPIHAPCYLEPEEVKAILAEPDRSTIEGQRDHTFLSFLYNTGARIQEALDVCPQAIRFDSPACVRLYGKGRKERICPLWPETVSLLRSLLRRYPFPHTNGNRGVPLHYALLPINQDSEERQARDLHCRIPRPARHGFPERLAEAFIAGSRLRSGRRGLSGSMPWQSLTLSSSTAMPLAGNASANCGGKSLRQCKPLSLGSSPCSS
jgi:integrase